MGLAMKPKGLFYFERDRGEDKPGLYIRIANKFKTPARVSDPRTGSAYGLRIEFEDEQKRPKVVTVSASSLHGNIREVCAILSDAGLFIDRRYQEKFIDYLQDQMGVAPSADIAVAPGWLTPSVFVLPDGSVYGSQDNDRPVYYGGEHVQNYQTSGELDDWQFEVGLLCRGNSRLMAGVAAALAGPLLEIAGESSGGLHFYGLTSGGKTTLLLVAGSACGGGDARVGFIDSWRTTSNGLEPVLTSHNDGTVFLDELGQADPRTIAEIVYTIGNNTGKKRMTRTLTAAPTMRWRTLIVSTGEQTIATHAEKAGMKLPGGAAVRILDIPADAGHGMGVFEELNGAETPAAFADQLKAAALSNFGHPLREFIQYLVSLDVEELREVLIRHQQDFIRSCDLQAAGPEVLRAAKRLSVIAAAGEMASKACILPWLSGEANDAVRTCFKAWRDSRGGDAANFDDERALEQIRAYLERYGESRFESTNQNSRDPRVLDRAGWRRRSADGSGIEFLIQPEFFKSELCRGLDPRAVVKMLAKRGFLRTEGSHLTVKFTTARGIKQRVYCLTSKILEQPAEPQS